jgi:hypothetical protein
MGLALGKGRHDTNCLGAARVACYHPAAARKGVAVFIRFFGGYPAVFWLQTYRPLLTNRPFLLRFPAE